MLKLWTYPFFELDETFDNNYTEKEEESSSDDEERHKVYSNY
jgi:hypothetical protein